MNLNRSRRQRLVLSYLKDWLLVIIMTVVFFAIDVLQPYHRRFSVEDKTLMYPFAEKEEVPPWALVLICLLGPILVIAAISVGLRKDLADFHSGVLGLVLALSMTIMMTDIIKISVGRPRPDFLDRCKPLPDTHDPPLGLSDASICTTPLDSYIMRDGFKSFPSGHSSFSFAGLGFLAFYLAGKMRLFDGQGHTYKGFLFAFPVIGALLVAITRTRDYRHHWQDVLVGGLLGAGFAYFAYRQYFPPLFHAQCDTPYALRIPPDESPYIFARSNDSNETVDDQECGTFRPGQGNNLHIG